MASIFDTIKHELLPHHETETPPMTTPQQRNVFTDLASSLAATASILGEVGANDLIAKLAAERLGEQLAPGDAEHVIALVRSLEGRQAPPAVVVPRLERAVPADSSPAQP